jgi:Ca2+-binding EF-hand superfamily protein
MSSKFAKQFQVPPEFPDILKDFTREVLRNQPENITEFAAKYFECLASGLPTEMSQVEAGGGTDFELSLDEIEGLIQDLFRKYDQDGNQYLDPSEFKSLMNDLQQRLDFPKDEIVRFLAEADMNADGMIEYEEFIPLTLQIIQGMYAKKRHEQHVADVEHQAEDLLVHGMSREELDGLLHSIFDRIDEDKSGLLSKQEFVSALTTIDLGFTRREINAIMFQVDQDNDGNISYKEFVPFAFDLLQKMTAMRLLETELEHDELGQYLLDLFKAKDAEMTGLLSIEDIRDLLHQAMLGLTRMQIYTVISEAEVNSDGLVAYVNFVPAAVGLVRSMLSFEKSIVKGAEKNMLQEEDNFFAVMDEVFAGDEALSLGDILSKIKSSNLLNEKELVACQHLLSTTYDGIVPVEEAKSQVWALVKSLRRTHS